MMQKPQKQQQGAAVVVRNGTSVHHGIIAGQIAGETTVVKCRSSNQQECRVAILNKKRQAEKSVNNCYAKRSRLKLARIFHSGECVFFCGKTTSGNAAQGVNKKERILTEKFMTLLRLVETVMSLLWKSLICVQPMQSTIQTAMPI